jgi:hypothetical protein
MSRHARAVIRRCVETLSEAKKEVQQWSRSQSSSNLDLAVTTASYYGKVWYKMSRDERMKH